MYAPVVGHQAVHEARGLHAHPKEGHNVLVTAGAQHLTHQDDETARDRTRPEHASDTARDTTAREAEADSSQPVPQGHEGQ